MSWDRDLERRLRSRYERPVRQLVVTPEPTAEDPASAPIVLEGANGHTFVSVPAQTAAGPANPYYLGLTGRLVEAGRPNANGAFWTVDDLKEAERTVANGPLNWLHEDKRIIGALTSSWFVPGSPLQSAGAAQVGPHVAVNAVTWAHLWPKEAAALRQYADSGQLWLSMECISESVTCRAGVGHPGCGETFDYMAAVRGEGVCSHLSERSSIRQLNKPTFLGAAVIVPPARPGWANAEAWMTDQSEALVQRQAASMERTDAESMVVQIMAHAGLHPATDSH